MADADWGEQGAAATAGDAAPVATKEVGQAEVKLFGKWSFEEVRVTDMSLVVRPRIFLPRNGRHSMLRGGI